MEEYLPIVAWGYIGIVFASLLFTLGIWAFVHGVKNKMMDNVVLGIIVIAFAFVTVIGSMWHFGLV